MERGGDRRTFRRTVRASSAVACCSDGRDRSASWSPSNGGGRSSPMRSRRLSATDTRLRCLITSRPDGARTHTSLRHSAAWPWPTYLNVDERSPLRGSRKSLNGGQRRTRSSPRRGGRRSARNIAHGGVIRVEMLTQDDAKSASAPNVGDLERVMRTARLMSFLRRALRSMPGRSSGSLAVCWRSGRCRWSPAIQWPACPPRRPGDRHAEALERVVGVRREGAQDDGTASSTAGRSDEGGTHSSIWPKRPPRTAIRSRLGPQVEPTGGDPHVIRSEPRGHPRGPLRQRGGATRRLFEHPAGERRTSRNGCRSPSGGARPTRTIRTARTRQHRFDLYLSGRQTHPAFTTLGPPDTIGAGRHSRSGPQRGRVRVVRTSTWEGRQQRCARSSERVWESSFRASGWSGTSSRSCLPAR